MTTFYEGKIITHQRGKRPELDFVTPPELDKSIIPFGDDHPGVASHLSAYPPPEPGQKPPVRPDVTEELLSEN